MHTTMFVVFKQKPAYEMRISDWSSDVCSSDLITAERWTRLDVAIRIAADETGYIDLRPETAGAADPESRRLMIGRVQYLEKMGLATPAGPGEWMVVLEAERDRKSTRLNSSH